MGSFTKRTVQRHRHQIGRPDPLSGKDVGEMKMHGCAWIGTTQHPEPVLSKSWFPHAKGFWRFFVVLLVPEVKPGHLKRISGVPWSLEGEGYRRLMFYFGRC